jgi:sphingomyelin phosphodiesterase acid-like 3
MNLSISFSFRFSAGLSALVAACVSISLASPFAALAQIAQPAQLHASAQAHASAPVQPDSRTVPALFISDVHFDPFHDPAKAHQLAAAPVAAWKQILSAPPSPDQQQAFAALQSSCHARGVDTPYALLRSSLEAMRSREAGAQFMTVSGDLIAHGFDCRFNALFPASTPEDDQAFVLKTIEFVLAELRASFPGLPVYVALGNHDSGCGDYQLDAGSSFLAQTGKIIAEALPPSERQNALNQFEAGGYYSLTMAPPMRGTRLIVVNDVFLSPNYKTCAGNADPTPATVEMTWLEQQLAEARQSGQKVWVMGHIPPGIDPYSTASKFRDVCNGGAPVQFLSSDRMADLLVQYADVVRLGIFAHTHMDEMRLLKPESAEPPQSDPRLVAIKIVPSISPVDGNNPSFVVARVNPSSAILDDYEVIAASNQTGVAAKWAKEYDYAQTYHEPEFSSATLSKLIAQFKADANASTAESQAYIRDYFVGDLSRELSPFWSQYVCAVQNHTARAFDACVCSAGN